MLLMILSLKDGVRQVQDYHNTQYQNQEMGEVQIPKVGIYICIISNSKHLQREANNHKEANYTIPIR